MYSTAYARIIKASKETYWYAGQIGKLVEIELRPDDVDSWTVCNFGMPRGAGVDKVDVERITVKGTPARSEFAKLKFSRPSFK
jgi:hypothetical protein